jgi:hypothetical protein
LRVVAFLSFVVIAAFFLTAAAPQGGVASIQLQPLSAARIDAWGECALVANRFPEPTILPVTVSDREAWHDFITLPKKHVEVKPCG